MGQQQVKNNPLSMLEKQLFEKSKLFNETVLVKLNKRLGLVPGYLNIKDVDAIDVACTFGQAWDPIHKSPWCSLFTKEMLSFLEYREDLRYYWQDGYGYRINGAQACVLVKDAIDNFNNAINGNTFKKGMFHFAHSGTVLKLLSYLGLYQEYADLTNDNYYDMKDKRSWKTSNIDPFATNIGFVLKKCHQRNYKIGLIHNEYIIDIPKCKSDDKWCDYDVFLSLFHPNVSICNFSAVCN